MPSIRKPNPKLNEEFYAALRQAPAWRLLLALLALRLLRIGRLRGWLTPERRSGPLLHVLGERRRGLRPVHLLIPISLLQILLFIWAVQTAEPLASMAIGSFLLAGLAMLPVTRQFS